MVCEVSVLESLFAFISEERRRFAVKDDNLFAQLISQMGRYREFLGIIDERHKEASRRFVEHTNAMQQALADHTANPVALHDEVVSLTTNLHLEIESFYLFAKILLDQVARSVEYYFGPARSLPLDSHDDLAKRLVAYSTAKHLGLPEGFVSRVSSLKERVSDYRDYNIAHEKSPRTLRATGFHPDGRTRMVLVRLYPTGRDRQVESEAPEDLLPELDRYLRDLMDLLKANRAKTNLEVLPPPPGDAAVD